MLTTDSLNFSRLLESQTPAKDVWINERLMLSSDVTTRNRVVILIGWLSKRSIKYKRLDKKICTIKRQRG